MRQFCIILFSLIYNCCCGQDTGVVLSTSMYNPIHEILIAKMDGWQFKKAGDTTWTSLKPIELSVKLADKAGRLEGWLRFIFKTDNSLAAVPLGLRYSGWAAAELFFDGKQVGAFGVIDTAGKTFREFNPSNKLAVQVGTLKTTEHEILLHFTDHVSPFSSGRLKSETTGLEHFIRITGPEYNKRFEKHVRDWPVYYVLWFSICIILTALFWLLAFLNPREKNLGLFATAVSMLTITFIFKIISESDSISFKEYKIYFGAFGLFGTVSSCLTVIVVAMVFKGQLSAALKIILAVFFIIGIAGIFTNASVVQALANLTPIVVYLWYIVSSRKTLRGAQWAIVIGCLLYASITFLYIGMVVIYQTDFIPFNMLIATGLILSFPLSLLVYVALRFKEIVDEVRQQAAQVLQLSEDKKDQALKQQKLLEDEVARQTAELRTTLENLKSTQVQLIQSEKMASLGELTAGIAHEIQNPLNFVNNFSEVSNELIEEMVDEVKKGNVAEAEAIANDIKQNLEKINHHGKRADSIVKGMLQHSRNSSGQKEPTDINNLVDECLRLSFHGMRAKDKSFNAKTETNFDVNIPPISIASQDIGRVFLNLFTNAFYSVLQKRKTGVDRYEPLVAVSTERTGTGIRITITDNGMGVPQKVLDKIFQPFFTTKPTGEGTGLGLSMSYDIITKAHGGELKVETKEGDYARFIIILPYKP